MQVLRDNLYRLRSLKNIVENKDEEYYTHYIINQKDIKDDTISIIMTAHERSKQVYFTLKTIDECNHKNVHIIIVDDSTTDPINIDILKTYNIYIELISIKRDKKYWVNPCINYNIGFQYIKGNKIIIQNSEVCYVGDVLEYVNCIMDDHYYVFDVKASRDFSTNDIIYSKSKLDISIYNENIYNIWYQHHSHNNRKFHFLSALTRSTFDKIKGFSYDYSFGSDYDDDDFLLKMYSNNIKIISVENELEYIGGIHLYHNYIVNTNNITAYTAQKNIDLYTKKRNYLNITSQYLELSEFDNYNTLINNYNLLNGY